MEIVSQLVDWMVLQRVNHDVCKQMTHAKLKY